MFTEIYIEALLVDEDLADQVWELWDAGVVTDGVTAWARCMLADPQWRYEISQRFLRPYRHTYFGTVWENEKAANYLQLTH